MIKHLIAFASLIFAVPALGVQSVQSCRQSPEFLNSTKTAINPKALPALVFVGTSADYYVENKASKMKLWGQQSFKTGKSAIVCADAGTTARESFSIYAPTLIDLTGTNSTGDSYWQFHVTADLKYFGIWNKKSRLFPKTKDLESGLSKTGAHFQFYHISRDQYELVLIKESVRTLEVLSIRFDAIRNLQ